MLTEHPLTKPIVTGEFEQVDGMELFVRRSDPANPDVDLVMVHGLGGMSGNWTDLMHLQAERGRRVMAMDLPGFGRSGPDPESDYTLQRHARAVIALMDTLPQPANLVGNSLGGAIATTVASLRPDLVRTLTLVSPALPHVSFSPAKLPILMGVLPRAADMLAYIRSKQTPEERVDETMQLVFGDLGRLSPRRRDEAVAEAHLRHGLPHIWHAFVESARGLGWGFLPWREEYLWRRLETVQAPVLAIFGTEDRLVDHSIAGRVARTIEGGTVVVLPGIGHTAQMEVPVTVDRLLDAHILGQL